MKILMDVFITILLTSLIASFTAGIVLCIKYLFGKKLSIKFNQILWIIVLVRFIIPIMPESTFSIYNYFPKTNAIYNTNFIQSEIETEIEDDNNNIEYQQQENHDDDMKLYSQSIYNQQHAENISDIKKENSRHLVLNVLSIIWIIGCSSIIIMAISIYYKMNMKIRSSSTTIRQDKLVNGCKQMIGIKKEVKVCIGDFNYPFITGVIKPKICLPRTIDESINEEQLKHIILHELVHYKRKDLILNVLWIIATSIHWFNPFMWIINRKVKLDTELACDNYLLNFLGENSAISYGMTIINISRLFLVKQNFLGHSCAFATKKNVKRRIEMIKEFKYGNKTTVLTIISGILVAALLLTNPIHAKQNHEQVDSEKYKEKKEFIVYEEYKSYINLEKLINDVDFEFQVPDYMPYDYDWSVTLFSLQDPSRVLLTFVKEPEIRPSLIRLYIAKEDISSEFNVLSREQMQIGEVKGEKIEIKDIPDDLTYTNTYFAFNHEDAYYMLVLSRGRDSITIEEAEQIISSLKKPSDVKNIDYTAMHYKNSENIYDIEDLWKARSVFGYNYKLSEDVPSKKLCDGCFTKDFIKFHYLYGVDFTQSKNAPQEYKDYLVNGYIKDNERVNHKTHWLEIDGKKVLNIEETHSGDFVTYRTNYYYWQEGDIYYTVYIRKETETEKALHEDIIRNFMKAKTVDELYLNESYIEKTVLRAKNLE
ncbi:hypothetical protein SH1V18_02620 [Vallitalea longa]|uniref:Peptidase M56 domain-containing protein n=1 Tax=Vallitalea longa TaxID=2936439 RepID=A0A9W6DDY1_9FIRM|nr:M56 family metallopeptidase [Vallitalea longa]GKX27782.1 hypothetical protein SH1V18_02620 [Vallitalea longa]